MGLYEYLCPTNKAAWPCREEQLDASYDMVQVAGAGVGEAPA